MSLFPFSVALSRVFSSRQASAKRANASWLARRKTNFDE
jgi:hypothetical protein